MDMVNQIFSYIYSAIDPAGLVKEAYDKDFRWWFLVLLVFVMGGGLWALRYLINQSEVQRAAHVSHVQSLVGELSDSRKHHHDRMEAMQAEAFRMVREVTSVVAQNNVVIESNTRESEKVRAAIERWDSRQRERQ